MYFGQRNSNVIKNLMFVLKVNLQLRLERKPGLNSSGGEMKAKGQELKTSQDVFVSKTKIELNADIAVFALACTDFFSFFFPLISPQ